MDGTRDGGGNLFDFISREAEERSEITSSGRGGKDARVHLV